jgi:hypothetical protein
LIHQILQDSQIKRHNNDCLEIKLGHKSLIQNWTLKIFSKSGSDDSFYLHDTCVSDQEKETTFGNQTECWISEL